VYAAKAVQLQSSGPHGDANRIFKPSAINFLPIGHVVQNNTSTNGGARGIARAKGERHLPGSYRLITKVDRAHFLSAPLPMEASVCITPLTAPGSWVKSSYTPTSADIMLYGFWITPALS